jgi:FlaA1/EpsC-like NDP-sugar epimerase
VIHAAAYKHVPFLESRPIAAAENNLLATVDWLRACGHARPVERFVFVSTDKAIRPSSVMGETKAGAEQALRLFRRQIRQDETGPGTGTRMKATTVRLCNVFGSRGSVVPRFWRRLQEERLLPVTHPEMKRRFISPNGAAEAILQALRHEAGTYIPTAGRELRIRQLAVRMVKWALEDEKAEGTDPSSWIRYTGRRRGERLRERLLAPEESPGTDMEDGLCRVGQRPPGRSWKELLQRLDTLRSACLAGEKEEARVRLRQIVGTAAESEKPAASF